MYDAITQLLDSHYQVRKITIIDRARFNKRTQRPGETVDSFILDLHKLADDCNYGPVKEELIRDIKMVGVLDDTHSLELQDRGQLTLSEANTLSRQSEESKQNQTVIWKQSTVNAVRLSKQNNLVQSKQRSRMPHKKHCGYCGKEIHSRTQCPANYTICNNCSNKIGQYQSICRQ